MVALNSRVSALRLRNVVLSGVSTLAFVNLFPGQDTNFFQPLAAKMLSRNVIPGVNFLAPAVSCLIMYMGGFTLGERIPIKSSVEYGTGPHSEQGAKMIGERKHFSQLFIQVAVAKLDGS